MSTGPLYPGILAMFGVFMGLHILVFVALDRMESRTIRFFEAAEASGTPLTVALATVVGENPKIQLSFLGFTTDKEAPHHFLRATFTGDKRSIDLSWDYVKRELGGLDRNDVSS